MFKKTTSMLSLGSAEPDDRIDYFIELNKKYVDCTFKNQYVCSCCGLMKIKLGQFSELSTKWDWDKANFFHQNSKFMLDLINKPKSNIVNEFGTNIDKESFIKHSKLEIQ